MYELSFSRAESIYEDIDDYEAGSTDTVKTDPVCPPPTPPKPTHTNLYTTQPAGSTDTRRPVPVRPAPAPPKPTHNKTQPEADVNRAPLPPPISTRPPLRPPPTSQLLDKRRLPRQISAPTSSQKTEYSPMSQETRRAPPTPLHKPNIHTSMPDLTADFSLTPNTRLANELQRPDITRGGPQRRAPPPRPRLPVQMPSLFSSSGYRTVPLYKQTEEAEYLDILPGRSTDFDSPFNESKMVDVCDPMSPGLYGLCREGQTRDFNQKALRVKRELNQFKVLLDALQQHVSQLTTLHNDIDKKQKKTKTANIAGGTTGTVGGVVAVVGVVLAPATFGVSLVATAIGAGMVATAGGIGARAAIANKKNVMDKVTFENIVCIYKKDIVEMESCAVVIRAGMDELRRYDCTKLWGEHVLPEALRIAKLSQSMLERDALSASEMAPESKCRIASVNLLQAFSRDLDLYFTEKNGQKLKQSNETKFASTVCQLSKDLQEVLDELNRMWEIFSS